MATCRDVVNGALRKLGRLGSGREPRAVDSVDTLAALQGMYFAWIASGAFGRLRDVIPVGDYTACENERIFRNSAAVTMITLPETVWCWWRFDCNLWEIIDGTNDPIDDDYGFPLLSTNPTGQTTPRDGSVVAISDAFTGQTVTFIYNGFVKKWQSIDGLSLDDEAPLSAADPEGLKACLALEVADLFSADIPPMTARQCARFQTVLTSRFSMPRIETVGEYF